MKLAEVTVICKWHAGRWAWRFVFTAGTDKKETSMEGLFDPNHKKSLPVYPMRIGVISARTGAAIQDILTTISRRWPLAEVCFYPSLVQGISASEDIIKNLMRADADGHDVILLARGGGSIEDLWCFNDEKLARCIYAMHTVMYWSWP